MQPFTFTYGPRIIATSTGAAELAALLPDGACLLVTDDQLIGLGLVAPWIAELEKTRSVTIFSAVEADPSKATLLAAVEAGRAAGVTSVVGFGGGSPMDVAKLAAYLLGSGDDLDSIWGVEVATGAKLPLILVPTTAGTGSEATSISVITVEGGTKLAVNARNSSRDWRMCASRLAMFSSIRLNEPPSRPISTSVSSLADGVSPAPTREISPDIASPPLSRLEVSCDMRVNCASGSETVRTKRWNTGRAIKNKIANSTAPPIAADAS